MQKSLCPLRQKEPGVKPSARPQINSEKQNRKTQAPLPYKAG